MIRRISKAQLEKTLAIAEKILNFIGYIPFVSLTSSTVRSLGGMLQIILGLCFTAWHFFLLRSVETGKIKHFVLLKLSFNHALHGLCNVVRAKIEAIPFLSLILCLPYDLILKKRFEYDIENSPDIEVESS